MGQALIFNRNKDVARFLKDKLKKNLGVDVVTKSSLKDGMDFVDSAPAFSFVFTNEKSIDDQSLNQLLQYLRQQGAEVPVVIVGEKKFSASGVHYIDPNYTWQKMLEAISDITGIKLQAEVKTNEDSFVPIPLKYFVNINETSIGCDVYIRVKKSDGKDQFVKRLNSTDSFTREEVVKYREQGLENFYIPIEKYARFFDYVAEKLTLKYLTEDKELDLLQFDSEVYELERDRIATLGVDELTVALVEENLKSMEKTLGEKNALADYFAVLRNNKMSYAYSRSYLISLLMNKILKKFEWDSAMMREKILYLAYFHDLSLNLDAFLKISNSDELKKLNLNFKDENFILNHAARSAEILDNFSQVPMGVSSLIREHHGVKTGVGFCDHFSIGLSPVSMMFIVVEDFVQKFLEIPNVASKADLKIIMNKIEESYPKSTYAQTVKALKEVFLV